MNSIGKQELTEIAVLESVIEAQLVEAILAKRRIPFRIQSYHDTAYDGLFQFQKGWGRLFAPIAFQAEIVELLDDIRSKPPVF